MKFLNKLLKSKENVELISTEQKIPGVVSRKQNYKNEANKYLSNNGDFEIRSMSFAYNENNKFLTRNDKSLINSLILCLSENTKKVCENIKNSESQEEIDKQYKLFEFLKGQLELIMEASHKSWENSEYNRKDKSISKISDTISEMQKNFDKERSDMIKNSRKALEFCADGLFKDKKDDKDADDLEVNK